MGQITQILCIIKTKLCLSAALGVLFAYLTQVASYCGLEAATLWRFCFQAGLK